MILPIVHYGSETLRKKSIAVPSVTRELAVLASDMLETMYAAKGVGLAAQQVGRTESLCVIDVPPDCEGDEERLFNSRVRMPLVMFNPQIVAVSGTQEDNEGCLSFPKIGCPVSRPYEVVASYTDVRGAPNTITVRGLLARAVLHETDHLNGILFIDRASGAEKSKIEAKLAKLAKANGNVL